MLTYSKMVTIVLMVIQAHSKLIALVTLSRHGKRAPNPDVAVLCPRHSDNMKRYNVPYKQLTPLGMIEMETLGKHIRDVYVHQQKLLSPSLSNSHTTDTFRPSSFETYMRADAADRCAQSAIAMGYGLYPNGTGPRPFSLQPVSVVHETLPNEWVFSAPKNKCRATAARDTAQYGATRAKELFAAHRGVLARLAETCRGPRVEEYPLVEGGLDSVQGLKDVVDALVFDEEQDFPGLREPLTDRGMAELRQLQYQMLMERCYGSDRMVTYWASGFPRTLLQHISTTLAEMKGEGGGEGGLLARYYSYHGHRELLYAMGLLLGWPFHFPGQPVVFNQSALPSGATLFFELHTGHHSSWLEFYHWTPAGGREAVSLTKCPPPCSVEAFSTVVNQHISRTGTFEEICSPASPPDWPLRISLLLNVAFILGWALWAGLARNATRRMTGSDGQTRQYQSIT